jgi:hypothetical protein
MQFLMEIGKRGKMCKDIRADAFEILSRLESMKSYKEDSKNDSRSLDLCNIKTWISAPTLVTMNEERGSFSQGPTAVFLNFFLTKPFWLRKITTDPHTLAHVNMECPDDR